MHKIIILDQNNKFIENNKSMFKNRSLYYWEYSYLQVAAGMFILNITLISTIVKNFDQKKIINPFIKISQCIIENILMYI